MSNARTLALPGLVASVFMLVLAPGLWSPGPATAQVSEFPAELYGSGLTPGLTIAAYVGSAECGSTTVEDDGWWLIRVYPGECGGGAVEGAEVTFTVNGRRAEQTVTWRSAFEPDDRDNGILLTVGGGVPAPTVPVDPDGPPEPPTLSRTQGLAIFSGGTLDDLELAILAACPGGATIWANDLTGQEPFVPFFANAPIDLLNVPFRTVYPDGFDGPEPVYIVGCDPGLGE